MRLIQGGGGGGVKFPQTAMIKSTVYFDVDTIAYLLRKFT